MDKALSVQIRQGRRKLKKAIYDNVTLGMLTARDMVTVGLNLVYLCDVVDEIELF